MTNDLLRIWVDGALIVENIPMHPGPLTHLAIWGWDRTGSVYLDNLLGSK